MPHSDLLDGTRCGQQLRLLPIKCLSAQPFARFFNESLIHTFGESTNRLYSLLAISDNSNKLV